MSNSKPKNEKQMKQFFGMLEALNSDLEKKRASVKKGIETKRRKRREMLAKIRLPERKLNTKEMFSQYQKLSIQDSGRKRGDY